jgi:hypothetical protein
MITLVKLPHSPRHVHAQYDEEAGNEAFADDFQQAMTYFTKLSLRGGEVGLKEAYDWGKAACVMDVGGGRGELLSRCMLYAGERCKGVLLDRPWVLDRSVNGVIHTSAHAVYVGSCATLCAAAWTSRAPLRPRACTMRRSA